MSHSGMSWTAVVIAVAAAVLVVLPSVSSIKCYQCNSKRDPHCQDLKANVTASQSYLRECEDPNLPEGKSFFCRKMVQTVLAVSDVRVIRKCGYVNSTKACYYYDDEDHNEVVCQCHSEACNGGPGLRATLLAATSSALLLLLLAR